MFIVGVSIVRSPIIDILIMGASIVDMFIVRVPIMGTLTMGRLIKGTPNLKGG